MEEQKQAKQQIQIDSNILNTLSKAVRVSKKKGNLDRDEYKKGINASKTETLFLLFENVLEEFKANSFYHEDFSTASVLLKGVDYTIKNIEDLCPRLSLSYTKETYSIGIFISAAINKIIKETDTIVLDFAGIEVNFLGYNLPCGNLIIKGSVGNDTGNHMQSGSITICGNAGICTGCSMKGGSIIVDGNAGSFTGDYSESGEIKVNGEIKGISNNAKAAIFCKGKMVK